MNLKIVYGVDFSSGGSVIVKAVRAGRRLQFSRVANAAACEGGYSVAGLATYESFARRLTAPLASVEKARKVLPSLLDVQLPFPLEKCVYLFPEILAADGRHTEALAVAARVDDITVALRRLKDAGFDPAILDHEALALWTQSLEESPPTGDTLRAILYVGQDRSALVLGRGPRFLAAQGSRSATPDPARIQQFLRAQLGQDADAPFEWAIVGPNAREELARELNRPADSPFLAFKDPDTFLARALATRALTAGPVRCNLRTGPLEHAAVASGRAADESRLALLALAAGVALCVLSVAWLTYLGHRRTQIQQSLTKLATEMSGMTPPKGQEVMIVKRVLDEIAPRAKPFETIFAPSTLAVLDPVLSAASTANLHILSLSLEGGVLEINGDAPAPATGDALASALRSQGWNVSLQPGAPGTGDRTSFTLKGEK